jgi:hypothetical protein
VIKASDECKASFLVLKETQLKLQHINAEVKRLTTVMNGQNDAGHSTYLGQSNEKANSAKLLYSRYSYCKSLLTELMTTSIRSNTNVNEFTQQRHQHGVDCGMLIDQLQLADDTYSTAVKAVLGG